MTTRVLICQNRTCRRDGSSDILLAFQQATQGLADIELIQSGCLGQCGSGPNVIVEMTGQPDIWYNLRDALDCVPIVVEQHLTKGKPVWQLMSPAKHPHAQAEYGSPTLSFLMRIKNWLGISA